MSLIKYYALRNLKKYLFCPSNHFLALAHSLYVYLNLLALTICLSISVYQPSTFVGFVEYVHVKMIRCRWGT